MNKMKAKIHYAGIEREVESSDQKKSLLDISIENRIPHLHECGGLGNCTTCRVRILNGIDNLSPRTTKEQQMAKIRKWDPSIRLLANHIPREI